jgi:DNA-binding CsgD family transcriptional regulator
VPELVEALVRLDRASEAGERLEPFAKAAEAKGQPWSLARLARCRGLLTGSDAAFAEALRLHALTPDRFEEARTRLCHGEALRRARRRAEAREPLRRAIEDFDALGAKPWADRARRELEASGETARRRDPLTLDQLTPRELQVALVLADGLTIREAATKLFLSPKTVDYHLRHVYRKLAIASRSALAEALAELPGAPPDANASEPGVASPA